jgi:hypothetical protein
MKEPVIERRAFLLLGCAFLNRKLLELRRQREDRFVSLSAGSARARVLCRRRLRVLSRSSGEPMQKAGRGSLLPSVCHVHLMFAPALSRRPLSRASRPFIGPTRKARSGSRAVDRDRLKWAESGPTGVASGRIGVRAIAVITVGARNRVHRPILPRRLEVMGGSRGSPPRKPLIV